MLRGSFSRKPVLTTAFIGYYRPNSKIIKFNVTKINNISGGYKLLKPLLGGGRGGIRSH